ncbi:hypothetical protein KEM48_005046 [Puccinia striiformis f. sp. tritici PST-130]|nr:hypothetical protein KEM48_005046 [Puccinia striiformis f. sp. tritici PST-130]
MPADKQSSFVSKLSGWSTSDVIPHDQQAIHTGHQLLSANPLSDRCLHHSDASFAFDLRQNMPASPLIFVKTFGHLQGIHSSTPADSSGLR